MSTAHEDTLEYFNNVNNVNNQQLVQIGVTQRTLFSLVGSLLVGAGLGLGLRAGGSILGSFCNSLC